MLFLKTVFLLKVGSAGCRADSRRGIVNSKVGFAVGTKLVGVLCLIELQGGVTGSIKLKALFGYKPKLSDLQHFCFSVVAVLLRHYIIHILLIGAAAVKAESGAVAKVTFAAKRKLSLPEDENFSMEANTPEMPIMLESMFTSIDITDFQIIYMLMQENSVIDISDSLFLSTSSVKHRISNMYKFLGVNCKKDFMDIIQRFVNPENLLLYIKQQNSLLDGITLL